MCWDVVPWRYRAPDLRWITSAQLRRRTRVHGARVARRDSCGAAMAAHEPTRTCDDADERGSRSCFTAALTPTLLCRLSCRHPSPPGVLWLAPCGTRPVHKRRCRIRREGLVVIAVVVASSSTNSLPRALSTQRSLRQATHSCAPSARSSARGRHEGAEQASRGGAPLR